MSGKDMTFAEFDIHLRRAEAELYYAIEPILGRLNVPSNVEISIDVNLFNITTIGKDTEYILNNVRIIPNFR